VKLLALFAMLAVTAGGTAAARPGSPNDGALTVKNGDGRIVIKGSGAVIGRFDNGQVTIKDPNPNDGTGPIVAGADSTQSLGERTTRYSGTNVRFRIIGGAFTVTVFATDIDLSAIGRGMATLDGTGGARGDTDNGGNGVYSRNGSAPQPFPSFVFTFPLYTPPPTAGGG
jgi:hypothetical protein